MTTRADNEMLTRVGKGKPMGEILRRYRVCAFATILPKDVPFTEGARDGTVAKTGELAASV
ncbi:MAG: hypothetical protein HW416_3767 [Chloroflexi bacterium]|nr:hypothetical protein [Chloroflexota bacterium]